MDEIEIVTVDEVPITRVALTKRYESNDPSERVLPEVVLHPVVEDNEEQDEPSKGGEDHDVKHERPRQSTTIVYAAETLGRSRGD